ncbi:MAG: OmpA family protein [Pseudomonadota bacterium]
MHSAKGQTLRRSLFFTALVLILCFSSSWAPADDCRRVRNLLVLFDASGFMKEKNRYQMFMETMKNFQRAMPLTADGFFNVGLRHYGLKVGLGCNNTESILSSQPWDPERFINSFPKSLSYGMSSLSAGLRAAADEVAGLDGKTVIILIGGGLESCKLDPVKTADQIAFNNPDLEIHTFQVGTEPEGKFFLEKIANKGRGTFNRGREMDSSAGWFAWMKANLLVPCGGASRVPGAAAPAVPAHPPVAPIIFDGNGFSVRSKTPAVNSSNQASLQAVGMFLRENPSAKTALHGYSDGKGSAEVNLKTSRKRAEAVAAYLISTYGIHSSRIGVIAHGAADGGSGTGPSFTRAGRRVEIEFIK